MSRYMVRICADGQIHRIPCKGILKLETLQHLVGGYIETVLVRMKPEEGVWPLLIVDEEGRLNGKPLNTAATLLAFLDLRQQYDYLKGAFDILRGENAAQLNRVKEIEKAYEECMEGGKYSKAWREFDKLVEAMPDRVWIE